MAFYSYQQQSANNMKYKRKLKKLKKHVENMVFVSKNICDGGTDIYIDLHSCSISLQENAAICDQVAEIQENISRVKEERRLLLKRLLEQDSNLLMEELNSGKFQLNNNESGVTITHTRRPYKKRNTEGKAKKTGKNATASAIAGTDSEQKPFALSISVDSNGEPPYPISLGALCVHNLGRVVHDQPGFHTENRVYPIGFMSTRTYGHFNEPERKCLYTCRITDNGGEKPNFEIASEADPDFIISGETPDSCHATLIQTVNNSPNIRRIDIRPEGDWFFGLTHPTVMKLLQSLPDIQKCSNLKTLSIDAFSLDKETNASVNYDALQRHIALSTYHTVLEVKEEPPDELLEQTTNSEAGSLSFGLP